MSGKHTFIASKHSETPCEGKNYSIKPTYHSSTLKNTVKSIEAVQAKAIEKLRIMENMSAKLINSRDAHNEPDFSRRTHRIQSSRPRSLGKILSQQVRVPHKAKLPDSYMQPQPENHYP